MCPWGGWKDSGTRPPWWPADEPWPPQGPPWRWRRRGHRLFWRFGLAFLLLALFVFAFFALAGWFAATLFGGLPFPGPHRPPFFAPAGLLVFLVLALGIAAAARSVRRMTVPVAGLMEAAGRLAQGRYDVRVREWGPPEVRSLSRAFNEMAERLQAHEQQRRNLLADVTHELRTPLAVIQGNLEGLLDGVYPRDDAHLTPILDETRVLAALIDDLRTLALAETGTLELHREPTDLETLIQDTVAALRSQAEAAGVRLTTQVSPDLPPIEVDPTRIRQVLTNLLNNALAHTGSGGEVLVIARLGSRNAVGYLALSVADTGSGIAEVDLPHIFDRFYRSKDSRGTGLGLAIARNLIAMHGGEISAESRLGEGTTMRITLPLGTAAT